MFQVELVWNREFHFVRRGQPMEDLDAAIAYARTMENMGDGENVKKTRIVDPETEEVVWQYGKVAKAKEPMTKKVPSCCPYCSSPIKYAGETGAITYFCNTSASPHWSPPVRSKSCTDKILANGAIVKS